MYMQFSQNIFCIIINQRMKNNVKYVTVDVTKGDALYSYLLADLRNIDGNHVKHFKLNIYHVID